jgi:Cobalamin biosynthesis protein CobT VWA domain
MAWWKKGTPKVTDNQAPGYPQGIKTWEVSSGYGYRRNGENDSFRLTLNQLVEFETQNAKIISDAGFFDWFDEFIVEQKLIRDSDRPARRGEVIWDGEESSSSKGKWLSSWWAADAHYGFKSSNEDAMKLAIAMRPVQSIIRVVDDTIPPMRVEWAVSDISYTDWAKGTIAINPEPVLKTPKAQEGLAIDISCGFALHEASHSQHTRPLKDVPFVPTELRPLTISSLLLNVVEDARIEAKTSENFPGFRPYFEKVLDWLWDRSKDKLPTAYGPDLQSKISTMITAVRWAPHIARDGVLTDPSFPAELAWWQAWGQRYLDGADARAIIEEGLAHLALPTEEEQKDGKDGSSGNEGQAKQDLDALAERERKEEAAGAAIRTIIKRIIDEMTKEGLPKFCPSPKEGEGLDPDLAGETERLTKEEFREEFPIIMHEGGRAPRLFVSKPLEDAGSRGHYIGKPDPVLQRLRAALRFRQELPQYDNRLLKEGTLDEEELHRWALGDYRLFKERIIEGRPKVQIGLLVDMSGSMMSGDHITTAQKLAQLFVWALTGMDGVVTRVWGHTGDVHHDADCQLYRLWEPGDPMTRFGLVATLPHANNYDGYAIDWCVRQLQGFGDESEQRVLIVLSDGYPSASYYGGERGMAHVRTVTDWAEKHGVSVIQIAIDSGIDARRQGRMFKRWLPFEGTAVLPRKLEQLLEKLT